ncbi:MAG: rhodanese-like domain-containing protein [Alphaproteobacteria bacterium]|jgi:thiosulfate/3-mercaptopyruvate sulfurtransferase|nr:rhodanese-like domain-containing protein [Alphaproteobacteria bacterium]MDP6622541.1 rhodanese-like domain-containing protein [Alphaproteobacteria bacterium]|tara:strand:+ start:4656 stop:5666 length:1011 start_codon:yes stop_codon:yes gene_type:complete
MKAWQMGALGFVALVVLGWPASADAAKWANPGLLASPDSVKANIGKSDWVVVDCRNLKDYLKGHIPGAISLGKKCSSALRDATSRMFRDPSKYEKLLGKVGIGNDTHVVFYHGDMSTLTAATVGFWVLEQLGHDKVQVLDGGLDAWRKAGNRLDSKPTMKKAVSFKAKPIASRYAATDEILQIAKGQASGVQLIDSRTGAEYKGKDVRAIRGGHIPNVTIQVSHKDTLAQRKNSKTGKMERIAYFDAAVFEKAFGSLDKSKRTIAYCQTGTRSTMTYLQLRLAGFSNPANWDESWRVWGSQLEYPVAGEQWYNFAGVNKKIKNLEKKIKKLEAAAK